jgi:hypothetical protein
MSITFSNFTHNIFVSGRRRVPGFGGKPKVEGHFGSSRRRWEDIKMDLEKWVGGRTGLIWLRTGTGSRLL